MWFLKLKYSTYNRLYYYYNKHDYLFKKCDNILKRMIMFVLIIYYNFILALMIYFHTHCYTKFKFHRI